MFRKAVLAALIGTFMLSLPMVGVSRADEWHHRHHHRWDSRRGEPSNLLLKRDEAQQKYRQDMAEGRRARARNQYNSIQNLNHQLYENDRNGKLRHGDYR